MHMVCFKSTWFGPMCVVWPDVCVKRTNVHVQYATTCVCMYVCIYACIHVCIYVCIYVYIRLTS